MLTRSFIRLVHVDQGYDPTHVAFADLRFPKGIQPEQRLAWSRVALDRVRAIPGVEFAGVSNSVPLNGAAFLTVVPPNAPTGTAGVTWWVAAVDQDYARVFAIPLKRGAWFAATPGPTDAVLSENAARAYFGDADPLGQDVTIHGTTYTVVGVVGRRTPESEPALPPPPMALYTAFSEWTRGYDEDFDPYGRRPRRVRGAAAPGAGFGGSHRSPRSRAIDGRDNFRFRREYRAVRVALGGIFGNRPDHGRHRHLWCRLARGRSRRTREIGIRMALGAERGAVQTLIVGGGALLLGIGLAVGFAGTVATTRLLRKILFQVSPMDPAAVSVVAALLAVTVLLASYIPARRAAAVDPMIALRQE